MFDLDWDDLWEALCRRLPVCRCDEPDDKPVSVAPAPPRPGRAQRLEFTAWQILKDHEALRLRAYMPTRNDVWTIGWGHTATAREGMVITLETAQRLLDSDVEWAEEAVRQLITAPLRQHQFDALVSFVFNVGAAAFKKSTLRRKLNALDYEGAAAEFPRWNKQKGRVLAGLTKRRAQERAMFEGG